MPGARMLKMVVMKLMAPRMDEAPARCIEKIVMSTESPGCPRTLDSGGSIVHPAPAPLPRKAENSSRPKEGRSSQQMSLFIHGTDMYHARIINGTTQAPNTP